MENLSNADIDRFSRQLLLSDIGITGQVKLKNSSVLIIGAGGLGCPCALYLASAGIGHIGLVDYDEVELNNLHRQILHREKDVGRPKVESACDSLHAINSSINVTTFHTQLTHLNTLDIVKVFDVVVDASDNPATRYLVNDACVLTSKPLVWGGAIQLEGQLTVYNARGGPCYRCMFPQPPPAETVTNCGEGGVLGPVPGTIGILQAIQVINFLLNLPILSAKLLLFDAYECNFRRITLRDKRSDCAVCGINPSITSLMDYEQFCGAKACDKSPNLHLLSDCDRISVQELSAIREKPHLLIDVRTTNEFQICALNGSRNFPLKTLAHSKVLNDLETFLLEEQQKTKDNLSVYVICRRGNDSQRAVLLLKKHFLNVAVKDIIGGLHAWSRLIDPTFPIY